MRFAEPGSNHRLANILAAVGVGQLRRIESIIEGRIRLADRYHALLSGIKGLRTPAVLPGAKHTYQSFCVYIEEDGRRDIVLEEMRRRGIEVQIGTYAIHREPVFSSARICGELENSRRLADHLLTLPLHHQLTEPRQERVVAELRSLVQ